MPFPGDPWRRLGAAVLLQAAQDARGGEFAAEARAWMGDGQCSAILGALGIHEDKLSAWLAGLDRLPTGGGEVKP